MSRVVDWSTGALGDALDRVYLALLAPNFPEAELSPLVTLRGLMEDGRLNLAVIEERDGSISACMLGEWFGESHVLMIDYLAVEPSRRSLGYGGALLEVALPIWAAQRGAELTVLEVQDPREFELWQDQDPQRRLDFYLRRGALRIDLPSYVQPELAPGQGRVRGILLLVDPQHSGLLDLDSTSLSSCKLEQFLREYFLASEGPSFDDGEFQRMCQALRERSEISLLKYGPR